MSPKRWYFQVATGSVNHIIKMLPNIGLTGDSYLCDTQIHEYTKCIYVFVYKASIDKWGCKRTSVCYLGHKSGWGEGGKKGLESIITPSGLLVAAQHHSSYCHPLPFNNTIQLCYCFYVFLFFVFCNFILWSSDYQHHYQIVGHGQTSGWNLEGHQGISQIEIWGLSGWNRYWSSSCYITHCPSSVCAPVSNRSLRIFFQPLMFSSKSQLDVTQGTAARMWP